MSTIPFNAGDIEARLILDRSQFTKELREAERQADAFEKKKREAKITLKLDTKDAERDLKRFNRELERNKDLKLKINLDHQKARDDLRKLYASAMRDAVKMSTAIDGSGAKAQAAALAKSLNQTIKFDVDLDRSALQGLNLGVQKPVTIPVDVDGRRTVGQIQQIRGSIESLNAPAKQVGKNIATASGNMQKFGAYAALATVALGPVGAAVAALPGLMMAVIAPAAAVAVGIDGIKKAAAPLKDDFAQLKDRVEDTFEKGMVPAIANVNRIIPVLSNGLVESAQSLSVMADQVTRVASSGAGMENLQATFRETAGLIEDMSPAMSTLIANFLRLGVEGVQGLRPVSAQMAELGDRWTEVINSMARSGSAEEAVTQLFAVLTELIGLVGPLTELGTQIMAAIGPPLAAAIRITSGVVGVLADVFGSLPGPIQTAIGALVAFRGVQAFLGRDSRAAARQADIMANALRNAGIAGTNAAPGMLAYGRNAQGAIDPTRQLGDQSRTTGTRLGGLRSAAGSVAGFLGGGFGVAIMGAAVILGVAGDAIADYQQRMLESKQAVEDYAQALRLSGGAVNANIQGMIQQRASAIGLTEILGRAGISQGELTKAVTEGGQALSDSRGKMLDSGNAADRLSLGLKEMGRQGGLAGGVLSILGEVVEGWGTGAGQAADDMRKMNDEFTRGTDLSKRLSDAQKAFAESTSAVSVAQRQANLETAAWSSAYEGLVDDTKTAGEVTKLFAGAMGLASDQGRNWASVQLLNAAATKDLQGVLKDLNPSIVDAKGNIDLMAKGGMELQTAFLNSAMAGDMLHGAVMKQTNSAGEAAGAYGRYRQSLIEMGVAAGIPREAMGLLLDTIMKVPDQVKTDVSMPGALEAVMTGMKLKDQILEIPDEKTIIMKSLTNEAIAALEALGLKVEKLDDGTYKVTVDADTDPAKGKIEDLEGSVGANIAVKPIDADTGPATLKDTILKGVIEGGAATKRILADDAPAKAIHEALKGAIGRADAIKPISAEAKQAYDILNDLRGKILEPDTKPIQATADQAQGIVDGLVAGIVKPDTKPIHGNSAVADAVHNALKAAINAADAIKPIGANDAVARSVHGALLSAINTTQGVTPINGRDGGALAKARDIVGQINRMVATIKINAVVGSIQNAAASAVAAAQRVAGGATGGIAPAYMHDGGLIQRFDSGGFSKSLMQKMMGLTPMPVGRAQIVGPNTWRVIGDRSRDDEAYIPINQSSRSISLLMQTAKRMGFGLVSLTGKYRDMLARLLGNHGQSPGASLTDRPANVPAGQWGWHTPQVAPPNTVPDDIWKRVEEQIRGRAAVDVDKIIQAINAALRSRGIEHLTIQAPQGATVKEVVDEAMHRIRHVSRGVYR